MKTMKASEAKQNWGLLMDMVSGGPVLIKKHGRDYAVIMSEREYYALDTLRELYNTGKLVWKK